MHKILVTELTPAKGHADLFCLISQILSKKNDISVDILVPLDSNINVPGCEKLEMPYGYHEEGWSKNRWKDLICRIRYELKIAKYIGDISKEKQYSALFIVTYKEQSFPYGIKYLSRFNHIFIIHNNNIDHIQEKKYRKFCFNLFLKKVCHVVLAGFIKDHLVSKLNVEDDKVLILPTPYSTLLCGNTELVKDIDCLGISNGNDEDFIGRLINEEKRTSLIKKRNLHIVLKSNVHKFDNGYLTIINGFLPRNQFDDYVSRSKLMLIPFPMSYKYRMSGTFVDALSHKIPVIATPIRMIKEARKTYPNIVHVLNEESFVDDVVKISSHSNSQENVEFEKFRTMHSVDYLSKTFVDDFISILEGNIIEIKRYDF